MTFDSFDPLPWLKFAQKCLSFKGCQSHQILKLPDFLIFRRIEEIPTSDHHQNRVEIISNLKISFFGRKNITNVFAWATQ